MKILGLAFTSVSRNRKDFAGVENDLRKQDQIDDSIRWGLTAQRKGGRHSSLPKVERFRIVAEECRRKLVN